MLKGTTTIELTDVHTGEKQVITEKNMITNAIHNLFQPTFGHLSTESTLRGYIPAYATLLGGLLLFDTPIGEDANQLYAPAGATLTGCARYNTVNTSTGVVLGSYNTTESKYDSTNKKMQFVYDFNTSQGNGTIASICLTHLEAGYGTYNSDMSYGTYAMKTFCSTPKTFTIDSKDMYSGISTGSYFHLFAIDTNEDLAYYFSLPSTTSLSFQSRQLGLKNFSLFSTAMPIVDTSHTITLDHAISSYRCYNFDREDNALYIISTAASTMAANAEFIVTKVNFGTWTVTQYVMTNTTDVTLYSSSRFGIVHRGQVYFRSNAANYSFYKIQLGNSANVVKLAGTASYAMIPTFGVGGRTYWQYTSSSTNRVYVTDEATNRVNFSGNQQLHYHSYSQSYSTYYAVPSYTPVINNEMFYYLSVGDKGNLTFYYLADYLATINNLSEPVTKTADKTMKITYTIEEQ
jgi:hypothetical protein